MEPIIGQIQLFPYDFVPENWLPCNGAELLVSQYASLFSLINTKFGGNGRTTFALPNIKGPNELVRYFIAIKGVYPPRQE